MSSALRNYRLITYSQYQRSVTATTTTTTITTTTAATAAASSSNAVCSSGVKRRRLSGEASTLSTERHLSGTEPTLKKCHQQAESVPSHSVLIM